MKENLIALIQTTGVFDLDPANFETPKTPIKKGEKVLGEMNDLEKLCFAFLEIKRREHRALHDKIDNLYAGNFQELIGLNRKHYLLKQSIDLIRNLMWLSVGNRFELDMNATSFGLREGSQVVLIYEETREEIDLPPGILMILEMSRR